MSDVLPEAREALRVFLGEREPVTHLVANRIGVTLGSDSPSIRLADIGGQAAWGEGEPLVQVECWGYANRPDDGVCAKIAAAVCSEVEAMRGPYAGGYVAGARVDGGPLDSPDPQTHRPRKLLTIRLWTYPADEE